MSDHSGGNLSRRSLRLVIFDEFHHSITLGANPRRNLGVGKRSTVRVSFAHRLRERARQDSAVCVSLSSINYVKEPGGPARKPKARTPMEPNEPMEVKPKHDCLIGGKFPETSPASISRRLARASQCRK